MCAGHIVSRDVRHQKPGAVLIDSKEIIEIAGNGCHRTINRSNPKIFHFRTFRRQNRCLNLLRNHQFAFNRKQAPLSRQRDLHGYIAKREEQSG